LLFSTRRGNPYSENKIVQKRLWPILDALAIPRCGMKAFRHGCGSLMQSSGASVKVTQTQLRHADASTTMRNYVHIVDAEQRAATEKMARLLSPTCNVFRRPLPRNGGKDVFLECPGCRKLRRGLYGWTAVGMTMPSAGWGAA
jgi:hypothetical protein